MATSVSVPSNLSSLPCILTDTKSASYLNLASPDIVRICQRPLDPTMVDIWYELAYPGNWLYALNYCGYEDSDGDWWMLKPDFGDAALDGTKVAADAAGTTWSSFYITAGTKKQFRLVWDASEYTTFLQDPSVRIHIRFVKWETSAWYAWSAISPTGTNGGSTPVAISNPET